MSKIIHVSSKQFDEQVLGSEVPVVVDFWADWCAPCHRVSPILDELAETYDGQLRVAKVDVDAEAELSERYAIRSIPTLLFVRGGEVVDRLSGVMPKAELGERFEALRARAPGAG